MLLIIIIRSCDSSEGQFSSCLIFLPHAKAVLSSSVTSACCTISQLPKFCHAVSNYNSASMAAHGKLLVYTMWHSECMKLTHDPCMIHYFTCHHHVGLRCRCCPLTSNKFGLHIVQPLICTQIQNFIWFP